MRHHSYVLLLSISAIGLGYLTTPASAQMPNTTVENVLQCVGLMPMNMSDGQNNTQIVEEVTAEIIDVYTFLRSNFRSGSILELIGSIQNAPTNQQPPDFGLIKMWFQVNLRLFLSMVSTEALSCLSSGNYTCGMYQTIVKEMSPHFSSLTPARQKLIHKHFMYPFLARNSTAGCVSPGVHSEVWLQRNFGEFLAVAQFRDFIALNMDFNGLDVLHLLTLEQKAELLLHPEMGHLDNATLSMVFESLLNVLQNLEGSVNSTAPTPGPSQPDAETSNGILKTMEPLGRFFRFIASFAHKSNLTTLRSHKLAQAVLNYTLSDLAEASPDEVQPTVAPLPSSFNVSSLDDWFQHVVIPLIHHFLPQNQTIPPSLLTVFSHVFFANSEPEPSDPLDICQLVDPHPCALANAVETLARIFDCVGQTNLTGQHLSLLVLELTTSLTPVIQQHCTTNVGSDVCSPPSSLPPFSVDSFPSENFQDVNFTRIFFQIKIRPALPSISGDSLRCLAARNFSCQSYQALVMDLSNHMQSLDKERREMLVYQDFIYPFLSQQTSAEPSCISLTDSSRDWVMKNFGQFFIFARLQDFFSLNSSFSAVEVIDLLSIKQAVELLGMPHIDEHTVNAVLDHFLGSPNRREDFLLQLTMLSPMNCSTTIPIIIERLMHVLSYMPGHLEPEIWTSIHALMDAQPRHCMMPVYDKCLTTQVKESRICAGDNNSSTVRVENTTVMCENNLRHYACLPTPTNLTSEHVAGILSCSLRDNMMYSKETWKLFFTKVSGVLHEALVMFANMTHSLSQASAMPVLDVIAESLDAGITNSSEDVYLINNIFQEKFKPFLPFISQGLLSCLSAKNFSCPTFEVIVRTLSEKYEEMDQRQQSLVYTDFIQVFLSRTDSQDPGCVLSSNGTLPWLQMNFGKFAAFLNLTDIHRLNRNFSALEALSHLTVRQLAEVTATSEQLETAGDVNMLMSHVPDDHLEMFFDEFSLAIQGPPLPADVRSAMLQQVLDRANLTAVSDAEEQVWLQHRLPALVPNMREEHVAPLFGIVQHRDCNISQEAVKLLSDVHLTLGTGTEREINRHILLSLREPTPLQCYANQSFYQFVKESFLEFPTPELSTFLSLMPPNRQAALINSIPLAELGELLKGPMFIDNGTDLCTVLRLYTQTPSLLEQEMFPESVRSLILPCVWPLALRGVDEAEVSQWFNVRLHNYTRFLNMDLVSSRDTLNASCLAFERLVFTLGSNFDFNGTDIREDGVYDVIKTYLSTDGSPKCYSPSGPPLNSTDWFFNYFHNFIRYINSDDFYTFGSEETLQVFSVNPQNIKLFSQPGIQNDVTARYTELIFQQDPQFNLTQLPPVFQCHVPGEAYSRLDEDQTLAVLSTINQSCPAVEPTISAALAGNIERLSPEVLTALGKEATGLSIAQISAAPPSVLIGALKQLGQVSGWKKAQSISIVNVLLAGNYQMNSSENLLKLGPLIGGCSSASVSSISPAVAQQTASNPEFVANLMSAPPVVRRTFVDQLIKVDPAPLVLLDNVPDELASEIPRNLLSFTQTMDPATLQKINSKHWSPEQAALFFDSVAEGTSDADEISTHVLQGFSCTRIQTFGKEKVKDLIRACRRRNGRSKVVLRETQLTCMYNHIKKEKPQTFTDFPPDLLLYFDYSNVQQEICKSYFMETGNADFNVLSEALSGKKDDLLNNARSCLGITGTSLNRENVEVLGNMCCTLDESYIDASDPVILEKLKNCQTFSDEQVAAMETVLLRGTTEYGNPSTWNFQTLESLGPLPVNLGNSFWSHFRKRDVIKFLRNMQKQDNMDRRKRKALFKALQSARLRRATTQDQCTVGNITRVTISDETFPFGYDATQFSHCLSSEVVKDNMADLAAKVDVDEFQRIVLNKLNQAHPSGLSDVQVQILGPLSRVASVGDISMWNITTIDSLAALMDLQDGEWEPAQSKAVITKYLETDGNTLGPQELNAIGGPNLCGLPTSILMTIKADSLKNANPLNVLDCPEGLKNQLFSIAEQAFNESDPISLTTYQLIQHYLGGAPKDYILRLSRSNVSMDIRTLISLNASVVTSLNVMEVKPLLGANVDDLKTYENMPMIQDWIRSQDQSALDTLGLNLTGGIPTSTTTAGPTTSPTQPGSTTPINTTTKSTTTTSGHDGTRPLSAHRLSLFLGLTFVIMQLL